MLKKRIITHPVHGECAYFDNGIIEIGVPLSFGIRISHFSFLGEENVFFVQPKDFNLVIGKMGFRIRGGHRLWLSPETEDDYFPDDEPIEYSVKGNTVYLRQKKDPLLNVIKSMEVTLKGSEVHITHRVENTGKKRKAALWALSVMNGGGTLTIPLPKSTGGFDPNVHISAWDYTNLGNDRLKFSKEEIKVLPGGNKTALKIGVGHPAGAVVYENGDTVFKKKVPFFAQKEYPDGGVSFETFAIDCMTEIEGLSPLMSIAHGETAKYKEIWELRRKNED